MTHTQATTAFGFLARSFFLIFINPIHYRSRDHRPSYSRGAPSLRAAGKAG